MKKWGWFRADAATPRENPAGREVPVPVLSEPRGVLSTAPSYRIRCNRVNACCPSGNARLVSRIAAGFVSRRPLVERLPSPHRPLASPIGYTLAFSQGILRRWPAEATRHGERPPNQGKAPRFPGFSVCGVRYSHPTGIYGPRRHPAPSHPALSAIPGSHYNRPDGSAKGSGT